MKQKLAIIGASYLQLPLVLKAKEMGLETHCFAWAEGADCRAHADYFYPISIVEKEHILARCREIGIDGVCSIASDTAVVTVNHVATAMGLPGNDARYSEMMTNKYRMRRCFQEHGLPSPRFCHSEGEIPEEVAAFAWPLIVKPTDRSGSLGVTKVGSREALFPAVQQAAAHSFSHQAIIEEFISGSEHSIETISFQGKHHILQITDKVTTGDPHYVELAHHQPSALPAACQEALKALVPNALDALHVENGASHTECKVTESGEIFLIEVGARMGGDFIGSDLVFLSTGYDFVQGVIEIALGQFKQPAIRKTYKHSGIYFLSEETPWVQAYIDHCEKYPEIIRTARTAPDLKPAHCSADRSGYVIYQSDEPFCPQ